MLNGSNFSNVSYVSNMTTMAPPIEEQKPKDFELYVIIIIFTGILLFAFICAECICCSLEGTNNSKNHCVIGYIVAYCGRLCGFFKEQQRVGYAYSDNSDNSDSDYEYNQYDNEYNIKENEIIDKYNNKNQDVIIFMPYFKDESKEEVNENYCNICSGKLNSTDMMDCDDSKETNIQIVKLSCGHYYHTECIKKWDIDGRGSGCPLCRTEIEVSNYYIV